MCVWGLGVRRTGVVTLGDCWCGTQWPFGAAGGTGGVLAVGRGCQMGLCDDKCALSMPSPSLSPPCPVERCVPVDTCPVPQCRPRHGHGREEPEET